VGCAFLALQKNVASSAQSLSPSVRASWRSESNNGNTLSRTVPEGTLASQPAFESSINADRKKLDPPWSTRELHQRLPIRSSAQERQKESSMGKLAPNGMTPHYAKRHSRPTALEDCVSLAKVEKQVNINFSVFNNFMGNHQFLVRFSTPSVIVDASATGSNERAFRSGLPAGTELTGDGVAHKNRGLATQSVDENLCLGGGCRLLAERKARAGGRPKRPPTAKKNSKANQGERNSSG
jgi:hypothetical protein